MTVKMIIKSRPVLAAAFAALAVAGCTGSNDPQTTAVYAQQNHPITVRRDVSYIDVPVKDGRFEVGALLRSDLEAFAQSHQASGHSRVRISVPTGTANAGAARSAAMQISAALGHAGIAQGDIEILTYSGSADTNSVKLSFDRFVADGPSCQGNWSKSMAEAGTNQRWGGLGCASQRNLAAMVADPLDLVRMRAMTPADAARRDVVFDKYRKGEPTSATRALDETATTQGN